MAHPIIQNHTALAQQMLFANDEAFRPLVAPILKATFDIGSDGTLTFAQEQAPVLLAPEHYGDPETSSYRLEPECAFTKPATDVVVLGQALPPQGMATHLKVDIQVGPLFKRLVVVGDRQWQRDASGWWVSRPEPFAAMPLVYERAFGGADRRYPDPNRHSFEARNSVGRGFYLPDGHDYPAEQPLWLPNIEDPNALVERIDDRPTPVGCGFTLPFWQPRAVWAGTYDQHWQETRSPLLPEDFDRRFFNAASPGLISDGYLYGDEPVHIQNMTPGGVLAFQLPGIKPPFCEIQCRDLEPVTLPTHLDTVIVDLEHSRLQLIWRNHLLLNTGPLDVQSLDIYYA